MNAPRKSYVSAGPGAMNVGSALTSDVAWFRDVDLVVTHGRKRREPKPTPERATLRERSRREKALDDALATRRPPNAGW